MADENGNRTLHSSMREAADRIGIGFRAGSHLFGVYVAQATQADLTARRFDSWSTEERSCSVAESTTLASVTSDQEDGSGDDRRPLCDRRRPRC